MKKKLKVLDLYCGLGGLSLGFELTEGYKIIAGIDNFEMAVNTFNLNHNIDSKICSIPQDMSILAPSAVLDDLGEKPDIIVGGPPCQGFSHAGKRNDDFRIDPRNLQVYNFQKFVSEMQPKVFLMENVSGILSTGQNKRNELLYDLITKYEEIGYKVAWKICNSSDFRVPQNRKRLILVGIHDSEKKFQFPTQPCKDNSDLFHEYEHYNTVADALDDLPTPNINEPQEYEEEPHSPLQKFLRIDSENIYNHLVTNHSSETIEKIKKQKNGKPLYSNWNHSWVRLTSSKPSPAVKENHRAPFVHHIEHRSVSPRECARLQTIPDRYVIKGTKTAQLILLGNAVPSIFSAHIATEIACQVFNFEVPVKWSVDNNPLNDT